MHLLDTPESYQKDADIESEDLIKITFSCSVCQEEFNIKENIVKHIEEDHFRKVSCEKCNKEINLIDLKEHMKNDHGKKSVKSVPDANVPDAINEFLNNSITENLENETEKQVIDITDKINELINTGVVSDSNKASHLSENPSQPSEKSGVIIKCKQCTLIFSLEVELEEHRKNTHGDNTVQLKHITSPGYLESVDNLIKDKTITQEKKEYSLNLLKAIEKKIENLERSPGLEISLNRGSSDKKQIYLTAETSVYEYLKINIKKEFQARYGIDINLERIVTTKTNSKDFKDANIEFQATGSFIKAGKVHGVKLTFYENCSIFVQQLKPIPRNHDHLENFVTQTEFFSHKYLLDLSSKIISENSTNASSIKSKLRQDL